LLPFADGGAFLVGGNGSKNFLQASETMRGELDGHADGVEDPSQQELARLPATVALAQFFDRGRFLAMMVGCSF
jgi:hypothetical protein